jgi:hypothetical protein
MKARREVLLLQAWVMMGQNCNYFRSQILETKIYDKQQLTWEYVF